MPALYVHIPFCVKKCYYCDFETAIYSEALADRYVAALERESLLRSRELWPGTPEPPPPPTRPPQLAVFSPRSAPTVFFGGGTPSTLSAAQLGRIVTALRRDYGIAEDAEVSLEANPHTRLFSSLEELEELKASGFNRLSIGVQTFDDRLLHQIGRTHSGADAELAISLARRAGFKNISLDLIFALPGQSLAGWRETLHRALDMDVEHISLYGLTIEDGTVYGSRQSRGELAAAPDDLEASMYRMAMDRLQERGFEQYEVSNFARPGFRSHHNQVYWRREDYLGLGVGAHSNIGNRRFANGLNAGLYVHALERGELFTTSSEELSQGEMLGEAIWLGLRMVEGIHLSELATRFGIDPVERYRDEIDELRRRGLLCVEDGRMFLSQEGRLLGNQAFCYFV